MFIYHFNRLIRNKILWGFFAIIIAIAFVAVDSCYQSPMERQAIGELNGEKISAQEFDQVVHGIRGFGRERDNDTPVHVVDRRAWEQIAAQRTAEKAGMKTTVAEVQAALREVPMFQGPNGFNMQQYLQALSGMNMTVPMFEASMFRQLSVMKCIAAASSAGWISPMELDDAIAGRTDKFTVQVAEITNGFLQAQIKLTEKDYQKFYTDNKSRYALPDQIQVRYVAVPASNYLSSVTVAEVDLQDYYDTNSDKYTRTTSSNTTEIVPFDKVKGEITAELKLQAALYTASTALSFQVLGDLDDSVTNKSPVLEYAKAKKLQVRTSPLFGRDDPLPWAEDAEKFKEAAFELDMESVTFRNSLAEGKKSVYLIELIKTVPAYTPKYEQVLPEVKIQALAKARSDAFEKKVKEIRETLVKQTEAGKKFAEIAKATGLNVSTSITYSANELQSTRFAHQYQVAYSAMNVAKGKISEAVPASASMSILVYVQDRKPGDALSEQMIRPQLRAQLSRRGGANVGDWLKWNLAQQQFKPSRELLPEDAKAEELPPDER